MARGDDLNEANDEYGDESLTDIMPPHYLRVLGDGEVLQVGFGYWVRVESAVDWTVEAT